MPSQEEQEELLAEARAVYANDPEGALELRRRVASSSISPAWSNANVDLASHEAGVGNYAVAAAHCRLVLDAPVDQVAPAARAVAGILLSDVREVLDEPIDEQLLVASIDAAAAADLSYYVGVGLSQLARRQLSRDERTEGKRTLLRAVESYARSDSMLASPSALLRLAKLESEDGNMDLAHAYIERALAHLDRFPLAGTGGHVLRGKLAKLRDSIVVDETSKR